MNVGDHVVITCDYLRSLGERFDGTRTKGTLDRIRDDGRYIVILDTPMPSVYAFRPTELEPLSIVEQLAELTAT